MIIEYLRPSSYLIVSYFEFKPFIALAIIKPFIGVDIPIIAAPNIAKNIVILWFFNSANIYYKIGEYKKAVQAYIRATQLDKSDNETYLQMALLYNKMNNAQKEKNCYKRAAQLGNKSAQQWCIAHGLAW